MYHMKDIKILEWKPSIGSIGKEVALDTETGRGDFSIADSWENLNNFPLVISTAYNVGSKEAYWIRNQNLKEFLRIHQSSGTKFIFANFDFDFYVMKNYLNAGTQFYNFCEHVSDIMILYRLLHIAMKGIDAPRYSLALLCQIFLNETLEKDEDLRLNFGDYICEDGSIDYDSLVQRQDRLEYAVKDAVKTAQVYTRLMYAIQDQGLSENEYGYMTEKIQIKAAVALRAITLNGIKIDKPRVTQYRDLLIKEIERVKNRLQDWDYTPGKGSGGRLQEILQAIIDENNIENVEKTDSGKIKTSRDYIEYLDSEVENPFLQLINRYNKLNKLLTTYYDKCFHPDTGEAYDRMHPRYNFLVSTGRTSSRGAGPYSQSLNIQNLPREGVEIDGIYLDLRTIFIADDGEVLADSDFSAIELVTLAQHCFTRHGNSRLRDTINSGQCPHYITASFITGKPIEEVTKDERQLAKAANFGYPGGCSPQTFRAYAKIYGVDIDLEQSKLVKEKYMVLYPEVELHLEKDPEVPMKIYYKYNLGTEQFYRDKPEIAVALFLRILSGENLSRNGKPYPVKTLNWAWNRARTRYDEFPAKIKKLVDERKGDIALKAYIGAEWEDVNLSNRPRGKMNYTNKSNYGFQSLAGDGAKLAAFELIKRGGDGSGGFKVVAFIHDQFMQTQPLQDRMKYVNILEECMISQMMRVTPDVNVSVETVLCNRFSKSAEQIWEIPNELLGVYQVD